MNMPCHKTLSCTTNTDITQSWNVREIGFESGKIFKRGKRHMTNV